MSTSPPSERRSRAVSLDDPAFLSQLKLAGFDVSSTELEESEDTNHGAVFTRRWVVELILDLAGYTHDRDLTELHAIEPACGDGAFLVPMVERLVESCRLHQHSLAASRDALRAFDLQGRHVESSRDAVRSILTTGGAGPELAQSLATTWVSQADFLLADHELGSADFVIGNPPYIRLEDVPATRGAEYRRRLETMGGRADIFVGFYEMGLRCLKPTGTLAFICADRWMRNQYGARLREFVSDHFSVDATIEMHDVDAFAEEVSAYPSITVIRRQPQGRAAVVEASGAFVEADAGLLRDWAAGRRGARHDDDAFRAAWLPGWFAGKSSWPSGSPERLAVVRQLEESFPPLEDASTGTRVGIGVATGADQVFVTKDADAAEQDRMLPLAMARDTMTGELMWSDHYLVDPWASEGTGLVALDDYPKLRAYFEANHEALIRRNVAGRRPAQWYRTIDRVDHSLTKRPKLLFPDIKATIHPVLDRGELYPHHNLYFVASDAWDIEALGGLLLSRVAQLFIESYAVRMRGGYLRFQAQYLRRIRVPEIANVGEAEREVLRTAFHARDVELATDCALALYGITDIPA